MRNEETNVAIQANRVSEGAIKKGVLSCIVVW